MLTAFIYSAPYVCRPAEAVKLHHFMYGQTLQYHDSAEGHIVRGVRVYELLPESQVSAKFVTVNAETLKHILSSYKPR